MSLTDKVCIITGGSSGIGRGVAFKFAHEGAKVVLCARTAAALQKVAGELRETGAEVETFALDVADYQAVQEMAKTVADRYGRVDVLVNCAGGGVIHKRTLTTTPEDMQRALNTNLLGTIYCTQAVLPAMLKAKRGTVINISSGASRNPSLLGGMIYGAAKAAVNNFTAFVNSEFSNSGVRACLVMPGEVDTPALSKNRPVPPSESAREVMLAPEDMAEAIALIAGMPDRAHIQELIIRPTMKRDVSGETPSA
ncbi:MAG: SDR family oxidoreductase [Spirochaetales bacterium]|nr:SDR family oxidoreductase [Spirochaetales bacterium]